MIKYKLDDWVRALEKVPVLHKLNRDKKQGYKAVDALGLPRYKRIIIESSNITNKVLSELNCRLFLVTALPKQKDLRRSTKYNIEKDQVMEYVESFKEDDYHFMISQFFTNEYGGSIIIGDYNQTIYAEFKRGTQGEIARAKVTPEFIVKRTTFIKKFEYNFNDVVLKEAIYKTFKSIPHNKRGRVLRFHPGYYEFILYKTGSVLKPIFIDYMDVTYVN